MKFVATTDDSIGGMLIDGNKVVTATVIDGRKVVEIIEATEDQLKNILPGLSSIYNQLKEFFMSLFNRFPCAIVEGGNTYILTEQPAPFKGIDRVFYMNDADKNDCIYMEEAVSMTKAKNELFKALKVKGYVH